MEKSTFSLDTSLLNDEQREIFFSVVVSLAAHPSEWHIKKILKYLHDSEFYKQYLGVFALYETGNKQGVNELIRFVETRLEKPGENELANVHQFFERHNQTTENILLFHEVRRNAIWILGEWQVEEAVDVLLKALDSLVAFETAIQALEKIGGEKVVVGLIEKLRNGFDWWDEWRTGRQAVVNTLAKIGMIEPLLKALENEQSNAQEGIAAALCKIGDKRAMQPLIAYLESGKAWSGYNAYLKFGQFGFPVAQPIINAIRNNIIGCENGAVSLGEIGEPIASRLVELLQDDNENMRKCAIFALGRMGDERCIEPLFQSNLRPWEITVIIEGFIRHNDGEKLTSVIQKLYHQFGFEVLKYLDSRVSDSHHTDKTIRIKVVSLIRHTDWPTFFEETLVKQLSSCQHSPDDVLCREIVKALEHIGSSKALEAVKQWREFLDREKPEQ